MPASRNGAIGHLCLDQRRVFRAKPQIGGSVMRFFCFGSSLVSAYWNGAATYYRGLLKALSDRGHAIANGAHETKEAVTGAEPEKK